MRNDKWKIKRPDRWAFRTQLCRLLGRHLQFTSGEVRACASHLFRSGVHVRVIHLFSKFNSYFGPSASDFRSSWGGDLEDICQALTATVFQPVPVTHGEYCNHWNGEEDSRNPSQLGSSKNRDN